MNTVREWLLDRLTDKGAPTWLVNILDEIQRRRDTRSELGDNSEEFSLDERHGS